MDWFDQFVIAARAWAAAMGVKLILAALIIIAGWILARLFSRAAAAWMHRWPRGQTVAPLTGSVVRGLVLFGAVVMALDQVGVPIATVIAGAGVVGLAVGFGAQALVKDVITGFFHIAEGVIAVGDVAQFGDVTGVVEEVGLRVTKVRAYNGQLWYIPNGAIDRVGNYNRGWCRAVVMVSVAYEGDVRRAMQVAQQVGDAYWKERPELVQEQPVAEGALGLNASDVSIRLVLKVKPQEHWGIERELRVRLKEAFDREGIEIPFPRSVVYHRQEPGTQLEVSRGDA